MADEPQINLKPETVTCRAHGELFRLRWPSGYLGFMVKAFSLATENPELWDAAQGKSERLDAAIAEFGPLCRLLTPAQRVEAYLEGDEISSGWASSWYCGAHRGSGRGAWGLWTPPGGGEPVRAFVCFECAAAQECQGA